MKLPYFPLYGGDFLLKTGELTHAEVGAYLRLLIHQWANGSINGDPNRLPIACADEWPMLEKYFPLCEDGRRRNPRLEREREAITSRREQQRLAGVKGAEKRWGEDSNPNGDPNGNPNSKTIVSSSSSSDSSLKTEPKKSKEYSEEFELFWQAYPKSRRVKKRKAFEVWKRLKPPLQVCIDQLEAMKLSEDWKKEGGQFIPHPTTWLNGGQWDDEKPEVEQGKPVGKLPTYKPEERLSDEEQAETDIARKQALEDVKEWGKKHESIHKGG